MKNKITDEQIIQSARRQRQSVDNRIGVEPWHPHGKGRGLAAAIAIAASIISFIAGYGLCANKHQSDVRSVAQKIQIQHDTILQTETIRDTVYQTRVVTKYLKPMTAQVSPPSRRTKKVAKGTQVPSVPTTIDHSSDDQMACSMLCDNIPYELLAQP